MTDPGNRIALLCATCGSTDITQDALANWCVERQQWELCGVLDATNCEACRHETSLVEAVLTPDPPRLRVSA